MKVQRSKLYGISSIVVLMLMIVGMIVQIWSLKSFECFDNQFVQALTNTFLLEGDENIFLNTVAYFVSAAGLMTTGIYLFNARKEVLKE